MSVHSTAGAIPMRRVSFGFNAISIRPIHNIAVAITGLLGPSLAEQIAPILTIRLGGNGITGVFFAFAPSLNDRLDLIVNSYDLKAGHGWKRRLRVSGKSPNHLATRKYDVCRALYNMPSGIRLTAEVGVKL
jgi:hypothetical protein